MPSKKITCLLFNKIEIVKLQYIQQKAHVGCGFDFGNLGIYKNISSSDETKIKTHPLPFNKQKFDNFKWSNSKPLDDSTSICKITPFYMVDPAKSGVSVKNSPETIKKAVHLAYFDKIDSKIFKTHAKFYELKLKLFWTNEMIESLFKNKDNQQDLYFFRDRLEFDFSAEKARISSLEDPDFTISESFVHEQISSIYKYGHKDEIKLVKRVLESSQSYLDQLKIINSIEEELKLQNEAAEDLDEKNETMLKLKEIPKITTTKSDMLEPDAIDRFNLFKKIYSRHMDGIFNNPKGTFEKNLKDVSSFESLLKSTEESKKEYIKLLGEWKKTTAGVVEYKNLIYMFNSLSLYIQNPEFSAFFTYLFNQQAEALDKQEDISKFIKERYNQILQLEKSHFDREINDKEFLNSTEEILEDWKTITNEVQDEYNALILKSVCDIQGQGRYEWDVKESVEF